MAQEPNRNGNDQPEAGSAPPENSTNSNNSSPPADETGKSSDEGATRAFLPDEIAKAANASTNTNSNMTHTQTEAKKTKAKAKPKPKTTSSASSTKAKKKVRVKSKKQDKANKKPKSRLDFWNKLAVLILTCFLIVCVGIFFLLVNIINDPEGMRFTREGLSTLSNSRIFDDSGNMIYEFGTEIREDVEYEDLPQSVIDAFLSIEDSRYFEHSGFDVPRFMMAAITDLQAGNFAQGGSTLTMQMIDNAFTMNQQKKLEAEKGSLSKFDQIRLKIQEIYLSLIAEQTISKEDIIEYYLNRIWFGSGNNTRGIQKASQYFFNKDVSELNLSEAAFLAGSVNAPSLYNPLNDKYTDDDINHLDQATQRRNTTLQLMLDHGYITQEEYDLASGTNLAFALKQVEVVTFDPNEPYIDQVINEAIETTGQDPSIIPMDIYTSLNQQLQSEVIKLNSGEIVSFPNDAFDVGIGITNNLTGEILAVGPGREYFDQDIKHDNSITPQQPGSAMKPLLAYCSTFDILGWSTSHTVNDHPDDYWHAGFNVTNADGSYAGNISLEYALGVSKNTPAAQAMIDLVSATGLDYWKEFCRKLGFDESVCENFAEQYCIGGADMFASPLQMSSAYSMFANKGDRINAHRIRKIIRRSDSEEIAGNATAYELISDQAAWMMSQLLERVVSGGYQNYNNILMSDFPVYGKSGTSDWGVYGLQYGIPQGAIRDEWSIGYTDQFSIAIWSGYTTQYRNLGYYIDLGVLEDAIAFHMNKYLIDYISKFEPCAAIPQPDGVVAYGGGWIKSEFVDGGDSSASGSTNSSAANACISTTGTWTNGACSCPAGTYLNGTQCWYTTDSLTTQNQTNQDAQNSQNNQTTQQDQQNQQNSQTSQNAQYTDPTQQYTDPSGQYTGQENQIPSDTTGQIPADSTQQPTDTGGLTDPNTGGQMAPAQGAQGVPESSSDSWKASLAQAGGQIAEKFNQSINVLSDWISNLISSIPDPRAGQSG